MKYEKLVLIEIYVKTAIVLMASVPTFRLVAFVIRDGAENYGAGIINYILITNFWGLNFQNKKTI